MFEIKYGVNTEGKFNYSTRTGLEIVLSDQNENVTLNDVFDAIGEMIDSGYEQFINRNTQLFGYGIGEEVIVTVIKLTNNGVELELHW